MFYSDNEDEVRDDVIGGPLGEEGEEEPGDGAEAPDGEGKEEWE